MNHFISKICCNEMHLMTVFIMKAFKMSFMDLIIRNLYDGSFKIDHKMQ